MSKLVTVLSVLACVCCVSEIANAQTRFYTQPPSCPGQLIFDGKDEVNNITYLHCECPNGSRALDDANGESYCPSPQAQTIYQQPSFQEPVQTDPAQEIINQML